jgi:transcriptional regulator with XRE-family HTH domain
MMHRTTTPYIKRMLGRQRAEVAHIIQYEIVKRGVTQKLIAESLGCTRANVSSVVLGKSHSPRVLDALLSIGIPEELLFDPRRAPLPPQESGKKTRGAA